MKITFTTFLTLGFVFGGAFLANAQTKEQRAQITKDYDQEKLESLRIQYQKDYFANKAKAIEAAKVNNWPLQKIGKDGSFQELQKLTPDGFPIYYGTTNQGGATTIRANRVNTGGTAGLNLNGQGMIIGIWDGGAVRATHQDLVGRVTITDGTTELSDHGTHVGGTMAGSGAGNANARGLAYQASLWSNYWDNDEAEVVSLAAQGLLVSNHSYGAVAENLPTWYFGAYTSESSSWDNILFNAPYYQAVYAAGNDRRTASTLNPSRAGGTGVGHDLLTGPGTSKNVITVAAVNQVNNYTSANDVVMSDFSNWGPTDDLRVKPDISAKGVGVFSTLATGDVDYGGMNGTSMAAPMISGALTLLQQHNHNVKGAYMRASTLRGLMIHTADEAGTTDGPDFRFGYGLMNTEKAANYITASMNGSSTSGGVKIYENILAQGATYTQTITHDGSSPLVVTLCWTDPAGPANNGTLNPAVTAHKALINDLDVKLVKGTATSYPWSYFINSFSRVLPNNVDNVEKVEVASPAGQYQIVITHKGNLQGGSQAYSLIVSGINSSLGNDDFKQESGFVMYPNPANDVLNFDFSKMSNLEDLEVVVFDMQGRQVKSVKQPLVSDNSLSVDISSLLAGSYVVKVKAGDSVSSKILIKK